jgi:hypothetical protein
MKSKCKKYKIDVNANIYFDNSFYLICFLLFVLEVSSGSDFYFYKYIMQIQLIYLEFKRKNLMINYNNLF